MVADDPSLSQQQQMVKQAIRQNVRGRMIVPLNALQWSHMVVNVYGVSVDELTFSDAHRRRDLGRKLLKVWDSMIENYHKAVDE